MNATTLVNATIVDVDVLIIGAGAAGLTAAYDLQMNSEVSYRILEASPGLGGRLQKLTGFADFPIDIGGEWIHTVPEVLNNITDDPTRDVTQLIKTVPYVDTFDEWDDGKWATEEFERDDYKFVNFTWFDFFNDYIAPKVVENLVVNCQVDFVDWSASPVKVNCADGRQWTVKHAIVTIPIRILQDNDITFQPALPRVVRDAIEAYDFLPGLKVFMKFKNRFYREAFEFAADYEGSTNSSGRYFYSVSYGQDTEQNVLGIFAVGDAAEKFVDMAEDEIFKSILDQLDSVYDGQATLNYEGEGFIQNWSNQTYIRGAYTYLEENEEAWGAIEVLRESLEDRIFFAGEAVPPYTFEYGNAHGASLSGRHAAERVMELMQELDVTITRGNDGTSNIDGSLKSVSGAMAIFPVPSVLSLGVLVLVLMRNID